MTSDTRFAGLDFGETAGLALVGQDLDDIGRLHMRLQRVRTRVKRRAGGRDCGGERRFGFDDVRLDQISCDFGCALSGFHGERRVFVSRTGVILNLDLRAVGVHLPEMFNHAHAEKAADDDKNDNDGSRDDCDIATTTLLLTSFTHVASRFRRLRRQRGIE